MVGKTLSRFTLKEERMLISMATSGATLSKIAAKLGRSVTAIERKAKALSVSIKRQSKG
jgi:hypothetical protein